MPSIKHCDGCGKEMDLKSDKIYPQRTESYCADCNKHFAAYDQDRRRLYFKFDEEKKALIVALKDKHFMKINKVVETVPAPVKTEPVAQLNEAAQDLAPQTPRVQPHPGLPLDSTIE